jgi:hypothetical protein
MNQYKAFLKPNVKNEKGRFSLVLCGELTHYDTDQLRQELGYLGYWSRISDKEHGNRNCLHLKTDLSQEEILEHPLVAYVELDVEMVGIFH